MQACSAILALVAMSAVMGGQMAGACEIVEQGWIGKIDTRLSNKRVKQAADCSFVNGGLGDTVSGEAALDLGNGRVSQRFSYGRVILTECATGKSLLVIGKEHPELGDGCGPVYELAIHEKPKGWLDYRAGKTLSDFKSIMSRKGLETIDDGASWLNKGERRKDQVDYFCGCKLFYPGSPGAYG